MASELALIPEVILTTTNAITPVKKKAMGVGYDIYTPHTMVIPAKTKRLIDTELKLKLPPEVQVKIEPISCSIFMEVYTVNSDKIDSDGAEPLNIMIANKINQDFVLPKGTLIGRMIYSTIKEQKQTITQQA